MKPNSHKTSAPRGLSHDVLTLLKSEGPLSPADIKNRLAYGDEDRKPITDALSRMKREGQILINPEGLLYVPHPAHANDGGIAKKNAKAEVSKETPADYPATDELICTPTACAGCAGLAGKLTEAELLNGRLKAEVYEHAAKIEALEKELEALSYLNSLNDSRPPAPIGYIATDLHQIHDTEDEAIEFANMTAIPGRNIMVAGVTRQGNVPPAQIFWERRAV